MDINFKRFAFPKLKMCQYDRYYVALSYVKSVNDDGLDPCSPVKYGVVHL